MSADIELSADIRSNVLEGRINVAVLDANQVVTFLATLVASPPPANTTTEDMMRHLETALGGCLWAIKRLKEFQPKPISHVHPEMESAK